MSKTDFQIMWELYTHIAHAEGEKHALDNTAQNVETFESIERYQWILAGAVNAVKEGRHGAVVEVEAHHG